MIGLLSAVFNISVCVGFPITVFIVLLAKSKKLNTELKIFIVGICTYLAAQILFRQPLLAILQNIDSYRILISTNRVAYVAVLAVTAACAEEVGRYIAFRFFVKNPEQQNTPLYFGLGHGGIEALSVGVNNVILLVCSPYTLINMGADVALAGVERISTLLAQVAFSYIVFCSYRKEKYRYLILAIILHTAYDLPKQSGTSGTPEWQSILRGLLLLHSASALSGRTERSADSLRLLPSGIPHRMPAGSLDKVNRCSG